MVSLMYAYAFWGVVTPLLLTLILFILAFIASRYLGKKYSTAITVVPLAVVLSIFLFLLIQLSAGYIYPLSAVLQYNCDRYVTVGYVEGITKAHALPVYYDGTTHSWSSGKLVTVAGEQYYLPVGDVKIGDAIALQWGNNEKVVYEYSINAGVTDKDIGTRLVSSNKEPQPNTKLKRAGQLIFAISLATFAIQVVLLYVTKRMLLDYLMKEDNKVTQRIIPNKIGVGLQAVSFLLFFSIAVGLFLSGLKGILFIYFLVFCGWVICSVKKSHAMMIIKKDSFVIKGYRSATSFSIQEISDIYFLPSRTPYSRCLVIVLQNGQKLVFDQIEYWGLSSAYHILSTSGTEGQGDSSVVPPEQTNNPRDKGTVLLSPPGQTNNP